MTTKAASALDAERRSELLVSRYAALTASNPGFHYHLHMRGCEQGIADADSMTSALVAGRARLADLQRLVVDEHTFQIWRLRLEHPRWWIGGRVVCTTPLLAQIVWKLGEGPAFPAGVYFGDPGAAGYTGAHWFTQTRAAIEPLSPPTRDSVAAELRRELLGRRLCMYGGLLGVLGEQGDLAVVFPESEADDAIDRAGLAEAIDAAEDVHGSEWADAFKTMVGDLDPIIWNGLAESLASEVRTVR